MSSHKKLSPEVSRSPTQEQIEDCLLAVAEGIVSIEWEKVAGLVGVKVDAVELSAHQSELLVAQSRWNLAYPTADELNR